MIKIEITEQDIVKCLKNMKEKPHEIAICRSLGCEPKNLEIKSDQIVMWLEGDYSYITFNFVDESEKNDLDYFIHQWTCFENDTSIETFDEYPISFTIDEEHDIETESKYWTARNFDYNYDEDKIYSKKHAKKHFDDDDEY